MLKRVKITSGGKVLRSKPYGRHRRSHKTKRRIRTFKEPQQFSSKAGKFIKSLINQ